MHYVWLGNFIRCELPMHHAAHGSVPGRSPFTAAARHLGLRHLLSRDVKDAFPSVQSDRFFLELRAIGLSGDTSRLLTKLLLPDGYIPQGGPASNAAMDLYFYRVDCEIERELALLRARYTRFTDGLDVSLKERHYANSVSLILERNLTRMGLAVNIKKLEKNGWQPIGTERVVCGVCVNSSRGTTLPRGVIVRLISECESLSRGARAVAPHTIVGLARRRRSLQGWLNQASQADCAPTGELQRRLHQADVHILQALRKYSIYPNREWYTKGSDFDEAYHLAGIWRERRELALAVS
jgi:hypothetical protein